MLKEPFFFLSNFARCNLQVDVVSQIILAVLQFEKKLDDTAQIEDQLSLHSCDGHDVVHPALWIAALGETR